MSKNATYKLTDAQRELAAQHFDRAGATAERFIRKHGLGGAIGDEIRSAATQGLCDAARHYQERRGVPFWAFARPRVVGEMCDRVRLFTRQRRVRPRPTREEMGCSESVFLKGCSDQRDQTRRTFERAEVIAVMLRSAGAVCADVIRRHDLGGETLKEIGASLGVSESRASQLRKEGFENMARRVEIMRWQGEEVGTLVF